MDNLTFKVEDDNGVQDKPQYHVGQQPLESPHGKKDQQYQANGHHGPLGHAAAPFIQTMLAPRNHLAEPHDGVRQT